MNLSAEEKKNKFCDLLFGYLSEKKSNKFCIERVTLESHGFDSENFYGEFWKTICPQLKDVGILKFYSPALMSLGGRSIDSPDLLSKKSGGYYFEIDEEKLKETKVMAGKKTVGDKFPLSGKPHFDENISQIIIGKEGCELPFKKIEYYITKALFEHPFETRLTEDHLMQYFDLETCKADSPSRIYDGVRRINQKVFTKLGIKKLIEYNGSHYWIRKIE